MCKNKPCYNNMDKCILKMQRKGAKNMITVGSFEKYCYKSFQEKIHN